MSVVPRRVSNIQPSFIFALRRFFFLSLVSFFLVSGGFFLVWTTEIASTTNQTKKTKSHARFLLSCCLIFLIKSNNHTSEVLGCRQSLTEPPPPSSPGLPSYMQLFLRSATLSGEIIGRSRGYLVAHTCNAARVKLRIYRRRRGGLRIPTSQLFALQCWLSHSCSLPLRLSH